MQFYFIMSEKLEQSKSSGAHYELSKMVGRWSGKTKVWFEPDVLADESETIGEINSVLNGMFVHYTYSGSLEGKPLSGIMIIGYSLQFSRYNCAWIDSFHNGTNTMYCEQHGTAGITFTGKYGSDVPAEQWSWRTEIIQPEANKLIITMYNISPESDEAKAVETILYREE